MQQQQQQQPQPQNPFPPNTITTEQIQKYLDENRNLILAIMENQNLGKLAECAQYQGVLQKNLMYLAAIADAQPQPSTPPPAQMPMPPNPVAQQGNYMQQPQALPPQAQQQGGGGGGGGGSGGPKLPFQLNAMRPQDQQQQMLQFQQQQQQQMQAQMGFRPNNGMHPMHQQQQPMQTGLGTLGSLTDPRGNKQDGSEAGSGDGQGKSAS